MRFAFPCIIMTCRSDWEFQYLQAKIETEVTGIWNDRTTVDVMLIIVNFFVPTTDNIPRMLLYNILRMG